MLTTTLLYILWSAHDTDARTMWSAYLGYIIAGNVQFTLNLTHIVPPDRSIVLSGFGQGLYCAGLVICAAVLP